MQERYLGDVHDYFKFLFLKFLSNHFKQKIGLNWFLVDPLKIGKAELKKNDGENRKFLKNFRQNKYDSEIIKELKLLEKSDDRKIIRFTKESHLNEYLEFYNEYLINENRDEWLSKSLKFFVNEKIIFLDPDNGFKNSSRGKASVKYVLASDIKQLIYMKKIVIFTQFQSFRRKNSEHLLSIFKSLEKEKIYATLPVIRNRTAPNTFYITILPDKSKNFLKEAYHQYSMLYPEIELIKII